MNTLINKIRNFWAVERQDGFWAVVQEGNKEPLAVYRTQEAAWENTLTRARFAKCEAYLQGKDGKIRARNSFGNDPRQIRG